MMKILETLGDINDTEALNALLLCEIRILYKNADNLTWALSHKDKLIQVHEAVKAKTSDQSVKDSIDDLYLLIGKD
jgi:hypothetical protein